MAEGEGVITLDWSDYDIEDKYFVIYRKQDEEEEWKTVVSLNEKFNRGYFIDTLGNDKDSPSEPKISIKGNEDKDNLQLDVSSIDSGTKYWYYIEAYDMNNMKLLSSSN